MCGIAGIVHMHGQPIPRAHERIERMTALLHHRGPDAQGTYCSSDGSVALGYARLSISDPSNTLPQPLTSTDGEGVLSFNGEIYNDLEVRGQLERAGAHFRTRMDTEVLLEGIRRDGEDFLHRLDGMWAFAYYDVSRRRLLLSRDVMGERHLFYRVNQATGELLFASEVQPILADADTPFTIDFASLVSAVRFSAAPPGRTLIAGVERLLPGHHLIVEPGSPPRTHRHRRLHPERWFSFFEQHPSDDAVIEAYESLFSRVCLRRIPRDVPSIATLSGGIDTSLICAFASAFGTRPLMTLYGESADALRQQQPDELDEASASAFTAAKFRTTHLTTRMNSLECVPVLHRLAENGFDGSIGLGTPSFEMLARRVREEGRKVVLISDGPDEVFGGYHVDQRAYALDGFRVRHPHVWGVARLLSQVRGGARVLGVAGMAQYRVHPATSEDPFRFTPIHESVNEEILRCMVPSDLVKASRAAYGMIDPAYADVLSALDATQRRALSYATRSLPDHFNLRSDKAFLRWSVECRLPHQAPEMVEFAIAAPAAFRFDDRGTTKRILRAIVERRVGPEIARRSKYGFSIPLFRNPDVRAAIPFMETLQSTALFDDLPFLSGARELVLAPGYEKLRWPYFVLAQTYDRLRRRSYA